MKSMIQNLDKKLVKTEKGGGGQDLVKEGGADSKPHFDPPTQPGGVQISSVLAQFGWKVNIITWDLMMVRLAAGFEDLDNAEDDGQIAQHEIDS